MDKEFQKMIGKTLQTNRKAAGFKSARAFAEHIGMEVSRYTEYEQGRAGLSYITAWKMADALECSMDELGGREWPPGGAGEPIGPDERALVDDYRRMEPEDRDTITRTAHTFALAGEAKKEGPAGPPNLALDRLTADALRGK